ncbi:hypothetical protein [Aureimonas sp. AU4]|uniref:hypothetical protein n=1 Tax=Aureimonas sp. AU4 TaxID=1638163 RepID=UPI0035B693A1
MVLTGEVTLAHDGGETILLPGMCAGFPNGYSASPGQPFRQRHKLPRGPKPASRRQHQLPPKRPPRRSIRCRVAVHPHAGVGRPL